MLASASSFGHEAPALSATHLVEIGRERLHPEDSKQNGGGCKPHPGRSRLRGSSARKGDEHEEDPADD